MEMFSPSSFQIVSDLREPTVVWVFKYFGQQQVNKESNGEPEPYKRRLRYYRFIVLHEKPADVLFFKKPMDTNKQSIC